MPASFAINIGDIFSNVVEKADANAKIALRGALEAMTNEAKTLAPKRTSALANSIRAGAVTGSLRTGDLQGTLSATVPHAEAQEFGSGIHGERGAPYPIRAKKAKALRFASGGTIAGGDAGFVFVRGVMHPGVKAKRYLQRGVEAKLEMLTKELADGITDAIEGG